MNFGKFLAAWGEDWTALMSGVVSIGLLFWATIWPPSQEQLKHVLFVVSAMCFVVGSYRIWAKEHYRFRNLTGKSQIEAIDDLMSDFEKLKDWYGSDEPTKTKPLTRLIERTRLELRHHAPNSVHRFNNVVKNHNALIPDPTPKKGRTIEQYAEWLGDQEREKCWLKASACLYELTNIRTECVKLSYR